MIYILSSRYIPSVAVDKRNGQYLQVFSVHAQTVTMTRYRMGEKNPVGGGTLHTLEHGRYHWKDYKNNGWIQIECRGYDDEDGYLLGKEIE